jgi:hypothetical protein
MGLFLLLPSFESIIFFYKRVFIFKKNYSISYPNNEADIELIRHMVCHKICFCITKQNQ